MACFERAGIGGGKAMNTSRNADQDLNPPLKVCAPPPSRDRLSILPRSNEKISTANWRTWKFVEPHVDRQLSLFFKTINRTPHSPLAVGISLPIFLVGIAWDC
jgi:hypothetical protein